MSKVAVVYWSGSGNTEAMAAAVAADPVICNDAPDDDTAASLTALGKALA